jgi:Na+/H+ antiporter NhaC
MLNKKNYIFALLFVMASLFANAEHVEFPDVMLKGIETDIVVTNANAGEWLIVDGDTVKLRAENDEVVGTFTLKRADFRFENEAVTYNETAVIPAWMSLLPALIAIVLALLFKEVLSSLFLGVFIGAAIIGFYTGGISGILGAFLAVLDHYVLGALMDSGHVSVILFSLMIGSIVAIISKNGGMQGVVNRLVKYATNRKSGMLTTYALGLAIFFDDYANTLVVGNTMRSVTDRLKISREKLAYIVDSTAAPVAAVAFITTWIGAELGYISGGINEIQLQQGVEITQSAYSIFISSLAYSFYPIFTLFFMFFMLYRQRDFGPMLKAEQRAIREGVTEDTVTDKELEEFEPVKGAKLRPFNAILPIVIVIVGTFAGLVYTGLNSVQAELMSGGIDVSSGVWSQIGATEEAEYGFFRKLGVVIGQADSYAALLWASLSGLFVTIMLTIFQRIMSLKDTMDAVIVGINTMMPAMVILILAWSLAGVTEDLGTAEYLKAFFDESFKSAWLIPAFTFVLSAFIAFSTGSSWSTMALMYPLVIPLSFAVASGDPSYEAMEIMYNTIASVLAGAVLGDHCSPISDTTILSSLATSCDHISHVRTQMPYALTVGGVALFIGIIPGALGISSLITIPLGIIVLFLIVSIFGKKSDTDTLF